MSCPDETTVFRLALDGYEVKKVVFKNRKPKPESGNSPGVPPKFYRMDEV
jgi:hypothetical protein